MSSGDVKAIADGVAAAVDAAVDAVAAATSLFLTRENRAKSSSEGDLMCPVGKIVGPKEGLDESLLFLPPTKCSEQIFADALKQKNILLKIMLIVN